jgi:HAD superfamily hydrolase (TIGR01509 family)
MLAALCLDLMGTVLYDPYMEAIEAATGMTLAEVVRVKDPHSWPDFEMGLIDEAEFVRRFYVSDATGSFDISAFHRVRWQGYRYLPGMAELLDDIDGVVPRYVASNYPVWIEDLGRHFDFARRFDGVFASCHLGVRKPDPAFFDRMLAVIGRPPQRCLFVDDRQDNCDAAAAAGMRTHLFEGSEGLRQRLREEHVLT